MQVNFRVGLGVASMLALVACGAQAPQLTWEEFRAQVYQEPDTGIFIVDGDEAIETEEGLREFYNRMIVEQSLAEAGIDTQQQGLIVNSINGVDDKYDSTRAVNLTYCVSSASFGSRYSTVVNAMNSAAAAWEGTGARINFIHLSQYDSACSASQTAVWFDVRQTTTTSYLARAFFPSTSRSGRNILISTSAFGNVYPLTLTGVLRHELGHTLGFRHEDTRPEARFGCFEDYNWRALTPYDPDSVMHNPQCNGGQASDLVLTSYDRQGCRSLYP